MSSELMFFLAAIANFCVLFWFMNTLNRIRAATEEIARNSRQTTLSSPKVLPASNERGHGKLINRSLTPNELIAELELRGAKLGLKSPEHFDGTFRKSRIKIANESAVDPDLVRLLFEYENDVVPLLLSRQQSRA